MVTLIGPAGRKTTATVNDKGDGTYSATYSCCSAGLHELYITTGMLQVCSIEVAECLSLVFGLLHLSV